MNETAVNTAVILFDGTFQPTRFYNTQLTTRSVTFVTELTILKFILVSMFANMRAR